MVQNENRIFLRFDPVDSEQPAAEVLTQPVMAHPLPSGLEWIKTAQSNQPKYSGEKIKLDFYDTDIKNVFRILRSVSGLNFAVDKDVQGKVTMSLEKPVPWDQLLDLVLKMNGLGKKMEGDVVRVATVKTLQQEEKDAQEAIASRKKALEQKKSLETPCHRIHSHQLFRCPDRYPSSYRFTVDSGTRFYFCGSAQQYGYCDGYTGKSGSDSGNDLPFGHGDASDHD